MENQIEKILQRLSNGEKLESIFKELIDLRGGKEKLFQNLRGSFLSVKNYFDSGKLTHEEFRIYENKARDTIINELENWELESKFLILPSRKDRTEKIIEDLDKLTFKKQIVNTNVIWSISFLSIFALDIEREKFESEKEEKLYDLLKEERKLLLKLANSGYKIKCIISPTNPKNISKNLDCAIDRTKSLLNFLTVQSESDELVKSALENIYWATTDYPQRNVYLIGDVSFYEGYKKRNEDFGYGLSSRQTYPEVIKSSHYLYDIYFDELSCKNLCNPSWQPIDDISGLSPTDLRRKSVVFKLEESLKYLNNLVDFRKTSNYD